MSESFLDNNNEALKHVDVPYLYQPSLALLRELSSLNLSPADKENVPWLVDTYSSERTVKARNDEAHPGRYYQLDQYLTAEFLLRPFLSGTGTLVTERHLLPNALAFELHVPTASPLSSENEFEQLAGQLQNTTTVPADDLFSVGDLEIIINRAYESRAFRLGITANEFPALVYPSTDGTLPSFINVAHSTKELGARIFMHRALQNSAALRNLRSEEDEVNNEFVEKSPVTIPSKELQAEVVNWAKHLEKDWEKVREDIKINRGKDAMGFPAEISVQGWARLDLDSDFVRLARKKMTILMGKLMKIFEGTGNEKLDLLDAMSEEEKTEFLLGNMNDQLGKAQSNNWKAEFFVAEYTLTRSIFFSIYSSNVATLNSGVEPLPADLIGMTEWLKELKDTPTAAVFSGDTIAFLPGIITDVPDSDITDPESFGRMHDPLLVDNDHDELITKEGKYSIYIHPLIWKELRKYLRSPLTLD